MNKRQIKVFGMFATFVIFAIFVSLLAAVSTSYKESEKTTTPFSATVDYVEIIDTEKGEHANIYVNEYNTQLHISMNIIRYIKTDKIEKLEHGQKIFFRMDSYCSENFYNMRFINIYSLSTDSEDIYTLEKYNECMRDASLPPRILTTVIAGISLFASLYLCYSAYFKKNDKAEM